MFDQMTLDNGLRIIGERIEHFRSVSVGLWIGAGSQYESRRINGVSHFIEHMLFKGTQKRTARQIAEVMDAVGGQLNAFTAKECTCFYAKVVDEHLPLALDVLCDLVRNSIFSEAELKKEKGVVLEEIAMSEDTPDDLAHELLMQARYGDQPLAWPILGDMDTVRAFTREDLTGYWKDMYRPEDAVLAVAGNYDWQALTDMARALLGGWERGGERRNPPPTRACAPGIVRREKPIEQLHICMAYPGVVQGSDDIYPLSILSSVFGGAMSSRLFQKIRDERGLAYTVYSYPSSYLDTGLLVVYAGTSQEHADEVLELIRAEAAELVKNGMTREEFFQAREQLKGSYILGLESTSSRMSAMGRRLLLLNDIQTETDVLNKVNAITYDQVMELTRRLLSGECAMSLVGKGADTLKI